MVRSESGAGGGGGGALHSATRGRPDAGGAAPREDSRFDIREVD